MNWKLTLTHPLHLVMGVVVWSLWLVLVYAGVSSGCAILPATQTPGPFSPINIGLFIFTLFTTATLLILSYRCWRYPVQRGEENQMPKRFILRVSAMVYLAGAVAVLATGLPMLRLPPCV